LKETGELAQMRDVMGTWRVQTLVAAIVLLSGAAASAKDNPESTPQPISPPEPPPALQLSPVAGWDNGFFIQSADRIFILRITGQIQADYRDFLGTDDAKDIDTLLARRARLGIEATMAKYYEFRLLPDFGQGKAVVQDAYMNVHYWDALQFEAGKFKQPFSYEQLIQDRFVPTMERSMLDQLVPQRDEGVMAHGQKLFGGLLDYGVSFSNGTINGEADTNDHKDLAGRLAVYPFAGIDGLTWLNGLESGFSVTHGIENELVSPNTLRTPATVPWFTYKTTVRADGFRNRWSPELVYFYGPFGFAAQYFREDEQLRPSAVGKGASYRADVPYEGYYVMATLLLTGEERATYSAAVAPLIPFDPDNPLFPFGAWELVVRFSRLRVSEVVFLPGIANLADPNINSPEADEWTLGFNWYLNKWFRMQFNWEHAHFEKPVLLGGGPLGKHKELDTLLTRLQIIF
jgi:phosphate-selective porin OprO/OprP